MLYFIWMIFMSFTSVSGSVFSDFANILQTGVNFGGSLYAALSILAVIVVLTTPISGALMIRTVRAGIYISILQFPFKLFLVVPPTFSFLLSAVNFHPSIQVLVFAVVMLFEIVKLGIQIMWLKEERRTLNTHDV